MCQKAPGPRCSGHAKASLAALIREVEEIQKSGGPVSPELYNKVNIAKLDYYGTPVGQADLKEKIKGNTNGKQVKALENLKEESWFYHADKRKALREATWENPSAYGLANVDPALMERAKKLREIRRPDIFASQLESHYSNPHTEKIEISEDSIKYLSDWNEHDIHSVLLKTKDTPRSVVDKIAQKTPFPDVRENALLHKNVSPALAVKHAEQLLENTSLVRTSKLTEALNHPGISKSAYNKMLDQACAKDDVPAMMVMFKSRHSTPNSRDKIVDSTDDDTLLSEVAFATTRGSTLEKLYNKQPGPETMESLSVNDYTPATVLTKLARNFPDDRDVNHGLINNEQTPNPALKQAFNNLGEDCVNASQMSYAREGMLARHNVSKDVFNHVYNKQGHLAGVLASFAPGSSSELSAIVKHPKMHPDVLDRVAKSARPDQSDRQNAFHFQVLRNPNVSKSTLAYYTKSPSFPAIFREEAERIAKSRSVSGKK